MFEVKGPCDNRTFYIEKQLSTLDVDCRGHWKLPSIMLDMQEIAEVHSRYFKTDFASLREQNLAWMLLRMDFRFYEQPVLHQKIKFVTNCGLQKRLFHYRFFTAYDQDTGDKLFEVNTQWTIVDLTERKAVNYKVDYSDSAGKTAGEIDDTHEKTADMHAETAEPFEIRRVKIKDLPYEKNIVYTPVFGDFDVNRHVNNTRYMEWVLDVLDLHKVADRYISDFAVLYKAEIPMDTDVRIMANDGGDDFAVRIVSVEDEASVYFECAGRFGD